MFFLLSVNECACLEDPKIKFTLVPNWVVKRLGGGADTIQVFFLWSVNKRACLKDPKIKFPLGQNWVK
jgi:hypothetical protein